MKKLILIFVLVAALFAGCESPQRRVQEYKQYDSSLNQWVYWYLLMRPNNTYYYYHSTSPIQSFRNVTWSTSGDGFNKQQAQEQTYRYVESEDFSPEMRKEFYQSENFNHTDNADYKYHQSDDFNTSPSTPSNTYDYNQSDDFNSGSSGSDYNSGESNDFGGSSSPSSNDGGSYNSNESNDFD